MAKLANRWLLAGLLVALGILPYIQAAHACWIYVPLEQLVAEASLIVVGRISRTDGRILLGEGEDRRPYVLATITVRETLKGLRPRVVRIAYPSQEPLPGSDTVAWASTDLTYHLRQDGIWILTKDATHSFYWADYPSDFQTLASRAEIKKALGAARVDAQEDQSFR
jgi:hypothetical protein